MSRAQKISLTPICLQELVYSMILCESCAVVPLSLFHANFPKSKAGLVLYHSLFAPNQQTSFNFSSAGNITTTISFWEVGVLFFPFRL